MADYISRGAILAKCAYEQPWGADAVIAMIEAIPAADVRPVVTCSDCKWWTKQESSLQGRCELLQMYPTGAWFCANGKREES